MSQKATVKDIVDSLFTKPPGEICSYQLLLDQNQNALQYLMSILIEGAKKLYGEATTPSNITPGQFNTLQKYILSLGYLIKYNYTYESDNKTPKLINIWFEPYTGRKDCHGGVIFVKK